MRVESTRKTPWPFGTGEMAGRIRSHDWAATPLGPIETWPQSLRTAVDLMLGNGFPATLQWGCQAILLYNDAYVPVIKSRHPEALGCSSYETFPEIRDHLEQTFDRVRTGETLVLEDQHFTLMDDGEPKEVWFTLSHQPLRDENDAIVGISVIGVETTARKLAERWNDQAAAELRQSESQARLLLAELQHRVRNTLAVIRSIARRTAASETAEDYAMHLEGRIDAFARVQAAVTRDPTAGVDLEMLVAEELHAHAAQEGEQIEHISGPPVRLRPKAAEMVALAIHELATNAVKYGALSAEQGRIVVEWRMEQAESGERLIFDWIETGMHLLRGTPTRRGFGMELIERTLAYELEGEADLRFEPSGLRCTIMLPVGNRIVVRNHPRSAALDNPAPLR